MPDAHDPRQITNGRVIPTACYADQPYIIRVADGAWLCVVTTGGGHEGASGQLVISLRSTDEGRSWSTPVDVEPADGPEASYAVLLPAPGGRVYCFYNHNTDNVREVPTIDGGVNRRVDSLGYFVCKYSDDGGRNWSKQRYPLPVREMAIDRENITGGAIRFFWNVGKPFILNGAAYVPLIKVGNFGPGFFTRTEGVLLRSPNLLSEPDPARHVWETLPDGDTGLRTPPGGGPIAEEQSYSVLSDGSLYVVYRTVDGHPAEAYSRDGGRTWSTPRYKRFADGRLMKHPRAANFAWRCENGRYLYWFHHHGGRDYDDRNPVWLCGGEEIDGPDGREIRWSQPEIVLYDDDPCIRMSYPDLVEADGRYYLTETQKSVARMHEIDPALLAGLWGQFTRAERTTDGLLLDLAGETRAPMPKLPAFCEKDYTQPDFRRRDLRAGFTLDLWLHGAAPVLLDTRTPDGRGLCLRMVDGTAELTLNDGRTECRWACDPGLLDPATPHHLAVIVDGGPKLILFVVDGRLCDGGAHRQFGWGRFTPHLTHVNAADTLTLASAIRRLCIFNRPLRVSEAIGNYRADCGHSLLPTTAGNPL